MSRDFIDDLLSALHRVLIPDTVRLKEILIVCGMPDKTANIRYLSFNRQRFSQENRECEFSAVAVINNRRADIWRLEGYGKKLSRMVFNTRWTRNPLDLFLSNLRCDGPMMDLLSGARGAYTLLGILQTEQQGYGPFQKGVCTVRPVVAVPGIDHLKLKTIAAFEAANTVRKSKLKGLARHRTDG